MKLFLVDPGRSIHYENILACLASMDIPLEFITFEDWRRNAECDLVLTSCEFYDKSALILCEARSKGIPSLHIVDGALEWRNTWSNSRSESQDYGMPLMQPILADKIACIGFAQARIFSSWGGFDKVEITGLPRLDHLAVHKSTKSCSLETTKRIRILIGTANTPYFTKKDEVEVRDSIRDLNTQLSSIRGLLPQDVIWRVNSEILPCDNLFGVIDNRIGPLIDALFNVDFFISTPSTSILEAMALGLPTCMLDYTNSPSYIHTAWRISSKYNLASELDSLLRASPRRIDYQNYLVSDQIIADGYSSQRIAHLILDMVGIAALARSARAPLVLPTLITQSYSSHITYQGAPRSLRHLFPRHPIFGRLNEDLLNAEIGHLRLYARSLEKALTSRFSPSLIISVLLRRSLRLFRKYSSSLVSIFLKNP